MESAGKRDLNLEGSLAEDYGRDIAILAGDIQHAWSVTFLIETTTKMGEDPYITLEIIKYMESYAIGNLIYGETVDVQMGMTDSKDTEKFSQDDVIDMLWGKTGGIIRFLCTGRGNDW